MIRRGKETVFSAFKAKFKYFVSRMQPLDEYSMGGCKHEMQGYPPTSNIRCKLESLFLREAFGIPRVGIFIDPTNSVCAEC